MSNKLREHYRDLYKKYGERVESIQWSTIESQEKRFEILLDVVAKDNSILDLGSGLGDLYAYSRKRGHVGSYLGLDFVDEFIEASNKKYSAKSDAKFEQFDINKSELPEGYDFILVSGMFNNLMEDNWSFICETLQKMFKVCNSGLAINCLSKYVDYFDDGLYYTDPLQLFDYCKKNISKFVTLRHDYLVKEGSVPFEFTLYLFK
ncbi:class I SAM-dependent methyltransferase [Leptospira levettii]|uniref:Class I SAM-dependent methyltransferase n=1 Tax=Leptospira levettii TaxID=2023178 RepID=A0AAW5VEG5_9LEPT|nr:class I SAM-dependent methyltransferase [Leptospira levettii]MCW7466186.1 class I SAM-dependent methyltransferase [Leptospira levettii]MCW7512289.1 class I SAM-dependent methyltransferase [Leptospira levettii]MCW7516297.1 class I SAM-dependent methyltransferase [Leptospira levettii]